MGGPAVEAAPPQPAPPEMAPPEVVAPIEATRPSEVAPPPEVGQQTEVVASPEALEARKLASLSAEARAKLEAWGATEEQIQQLQEIAGRYDYDKGMEKAQDIAGRGGYLTRTADGKEEVTMPGYYNHISGTYGTCGDIAARGITDLHSEGWLAAINHGRAEDDPDRIVPHLMCGRSREFFSNGDANHLWVGLGPANASPEELLIMDGSFREVETLEESAYVPKFSEPDPVGIEYFDTHGTASVSILTQNSNGVSLPIEKVTALGISFDRTHTYNLGFARLGSAEGQISPFVDVRTPDGEVASTCIVDGGGMPAWLGNPASLSDITRIETEVMVQALSTMKLEVNDEAATAAINKKSGLRFRENKTSSEPSQGEARSWR